MKKIIIIGTGIGGLVAANFLVKKGHAVTLFESHSTPGGYIAGFWRKGYYFESGTHALESSSQIFHVMKEIGVYDKINFVKKEPYRFISSDFDSIVNSWNDIKQMLYIVYPNEKENIKSFFNVFEPIIKGIETVMTITPMIYKKGIKKLPLGLSSLLKYVEFINLFKKYEPITVKELVGQFFKKDSNIYNFLSSLGYPNMSSIALAGMMEMFRDYWTVKGGMQSWSDILADNFKQHGGRLYLTTYVDTIITENGVVKGVKTGSHTHEADYVISASDYKKTFLKLLDDKSLIPDKMLTKINIAPVSVSFFTVYLGLDLQNYELKKYMKVPNIMLFNTQDLGNTENPMDENYFSKSPIVIYSPSLIDNELAPNEKSSLMIQTISVANWMNNWERENNENYKVLKKQILETLIKRTEKIIPNLSSKINFYDSATPITYERYTHNTNGANSSWSMDPSKKYYPEGKMMKIDTPIKNLFISSCWATPYGGVPETIKVGYKCAQKIIREL